MGDTFIAVWIQPFDLLQNIHVVVNGQTVEETAASFKELEVAILALCQKHNTAHVIINGAPQLSERIYEKLAELQGEQGE